MWRLFSVAQACSEFFFYTILKFYRRARFCLPLGMLYGEGVAYEINLVTGRNIVTVTSNENVTDAAIRQRRRRDGIINAFFYLNASHATNRELVLSTDNPWKRRAFGLTTEPGEVVLAVEHHIEKTLTNLIAIAIATWTLPQPLDVRIVLNYRDSMYGRSNAGHRTGRWRSQLDLKRLWDGDCINLNSIWNRMHSGNFQEYAHISADPQIGSIDTPTWQAYLEVLMAHELAHILEQYVTEPAGEFPEYRSTACQGHGYNWQTIYRRLRLSLGHVKLTSPARMDIETFVTNQARKCQYCGSPLINVRKGTKFCSAKCRVYARRALT